MTKEHKAGTVRSMAIRPRLQIDMDKQLMLALSALAGQQSVSAGRRITVRELVIAALGEQYPELKPFVLAELGRGE